MKNTNPVTLENLAGQHPYYEPVYCHSWTVGGHEFHIGFANGYNACGLIGTEHNGIFILSKTDHRVVLDQHLGRGCGHISGPSIPEVHANEIDRIIQLDANGLSEFLSMNQGARYNPFEDAKTKKATVNKDLKLRLKVKATAFTDAKFMTAKDKKTLLDKTEMFLRDRIFGGREYARDRFPKQLYHLLSGCYGHIAHNNKNGFYGYQFYSDDAFMENLEMMAKSKTMYGFPAATGGYADLDDLVKEIAKIAKAYLKIHESAIP